MSTQGRELIRYGINGVIATAVHFTALYFNIHVLNVPSAGLANLVAAVFGITVSFLGSRYFVFNKTGETITAQAIKFSGLYGTMAILHGLVLLVWTDWLTLDYRDGFLIATSFQVSISYLGNKFLVFKA